MSVIHHDLGIVIRLEARPRPRRDAYIRERGTVWQLSGWSRSIRNVYGHRPYHLTAESPGGRIMGILSLIHLSPMPVGGSLVSLPFFDGGGIAADDAAAATALVNAAISLGRRLKIRKLELRHLEPRPVIENRFPAAIRTAMDKERLSLRLPPSSNALLAGFKSKLRSQIKRPMKVGLTASVGGPELLDGFYRVFSENMRDLGSPVHHVGLIRETLNAFPGDARLVLVHGPDQTPLAGGVVVGMGRTLHNPWASSLRRFGHLSPNMLLYWTMLSWACDQGYEVFDFGRSTIDSGPYQFKRQWGAMPEPIYWYRIPLDDTAATKPAAPPSPGPFAVDEGGSSLDIAGLVVSLWQRLPVPLATRLGPAIRKWIAR